jgi:DNA-binding NarL/FixJ family response regulator
MFMERQAIGAPIPPVDRATYECSVATARAQLGEKAFAKAWAEGQTMTLEQILAVQEPTTRPEQVPRVARVEAVGADLSRPPPIYRPPAPTAKTAPMYPAGLTTREVEVLRLVAQGLTDAQVAEQLVISPRTVNFHLTSIYSKIGVSSRAAATRYAIEYHLV